MHSQNLARPVSPTLTARRAVSTAQVLDTRKRMAASSQHDVIRPSALTEMAEPFIDELLTVDEPPNPKVRARIVLALAGATVCIGLVIAAIT